MSEEIGHFHIKISGEIDRNIEQKIGNAIEKGGKKGSQNIQKELENAIGKTSFGRLIDQGKNFAQKIANTFGGTAEKLSGAFSGGVPKISEGVKPELSEDIGKGASKGASVGGAKGALAGGIMELIAKISIGIGLIGMVLKSLDSLSPIQGMIKMLVAILTITLYPIMQFFLSIFKPIIVMLLKYLILPFYYKVMPVLEMLGKWLGGMLIGGIEKAKEIGEPVIEKAKEIGGTILNWGEFIGKLVWESFVKILDWGIYVAGIVWETFISVLNWGEYVAKMSWETFIKILNWGIYVAGLLWNNFIKLLSWASFIPKLLWDVWAVLLRWADFIPNITWPDWGKLFTDFLNGIKSSITSLFGGGGSSGGGHNYTNRMAEGGIVTSPTVALIGESGPEIVIPLSKMGSMGNTVNVTANFYDTRVSDRRDIEKIVQEIERAFYTNSKRAGIR